MVIANNRDKRLFFSFNSFRKIIELHISMSEFHLYTMAVTIEYIFRRIVLIFIYLIVKLDLVREIKSIVLIDGEQDFLNICAIILYDVLE